MSTRFARGCLSVSVVSLVSAVGPGAAAQQGPPFEGRFFATTNFPQRLVAGDLDGDGHLDLIVINGSSSSAAVLKGDGAGSFGAATTLLVSNSAPVDVELVDVDGNGTLDLLLPFTKTFNQPPFTNVNYVELRLNNGGGAFAAATNLNLANGTAASGLAAGDVNADGLVDLAVSQSGVSSFSLLLGLGAGAFAPAAPVAVGYPTADVALADVNHDGFADYAVAQSSPGVFVGIGLGTSGGFAGQANLSLGVSARQLAFADLDGDGNLDIATGNFPSPSLSALLGNGAGSFGALSNNGIPNSPQHFVLGDWNGDGLADAAAATVDPVHTLAVRLSAPIAVLSVGIDSTILTSAGYLASGDFDGDGRLDLASSQIVASGVALWRGDGAGGFGSTLALQLQNPAASAPVARDLNHDGDLDFVTLENPLTDLSVRVAVPAPSGAPLAYLPVANYPMSQSGSPRFVLADLDGDGNDDVLALHGYPFCMDALLNNGAAGFGPPIVNPTPTFFPEWLEAADMNLDGTLDAVVAQIQLPDPQSNNRRVAVYMGLGNGTFFPSGARQTAGIPDFVAIADANSDGNPDAVAHQVSNVLTMCFDNGVGGFSSSTDVTVGAFGSWVSVGDMNGDSVADFVVSGYGAKVWLSNGAGALTPAGSFSSTPFGSGLLADLDGDARLDFAASDYAKDRLLVSLGDGAGGLAAPASLAAGHGPAGVTAADFDKDGRVDLVSTTAGYNGYWNMLVFHRNTGTLAGIVPYGAGVPGCAGAHALGVSSLPKVGNGGFEFTCTNAPQASLGLGLVGSLPDLAGSDPLFLGVPLHVNLLSPFLLGLDFHSYPSGFAVAPAPIPNVPSLAGAQFSAQALWVWFPPACQPSTYGLSVSGGLTITIH